MSLRLHLCAAACLAAASLAAHADTLINFQVNGAGINYVPVEVGVFNQQPFTSTGTATYDVDTNSFQSVSISGVPFSFNETDVQFDGYEYQGICSDYYCLTIDGTLASGFGYSAYAYGQLEFGYPYPNDPTMTGGEREFETSQGVFTEVAATPEPSTFVLLGTGILGVSGVMKRRFA